MLFLLIQSVWSFGSLGNYRFFNEII